MLKPVSHVVEAEWVADVLAVLPAHGYRLSRPVPTGTGGWTEAGWTAWRFVEGVHDFRGRWPEVVATSGRFHAVLRAVQRPAFLDDRDDNSSRGDRAAWNDEVPGVVHEELRALVEELAAFRTPTQLRSQVIHGDLTGNVLFARGEPPAIIDFVPYWRPAEFALAVVVADAIAWHQADFDLVRLIPPVAERRSLLARAALYRLITSDEAATQLAGEDSMYLRLTLDAHARIRDALRTM